MQAQPDEQSQGLGIKPIHKVCLLVCSFFFSEESHNFPVTVVFALVGFSRVDFNPLGSWCFILIVLWYQVCCFLTQPNLVIAYEHPGNARAELRNYSICPQLRIHVGRSVVCTKTPTLPCGMGLVLGYFSGGFSYLEKPRKITRSSYDSIPRMIK